jgi:predicted nucleic acid-binding protein
MIYLLDVNALVALGFLNHEFHARVARWIQSSRPLQLASCSITELGFVRVLSQATAYGFTVAHART